MDQPGKVANPARGQLNRENNIPLSPCVPENLVSRDGFSRPVPRPSAHLHTQAEPGAYLRDSSRVPQRRPFMKPPYAMGSVASLSGHAVAYRWRSLPRVRRHRASKAQGGSERVLPWHITMDQTIIIAPNLCSICKSCPARNKQCCCRSVVCSCSSIVLRLCSHIRFASPQPSTADATAQPTYLVTSATC